MNCRRVNSLLSAYLDSELTGSEMLSVRAHLQQCAGCREEYETLAQTKQMVASLALKTPRAELEALLLREAQRSTQARSGYLGWLSAWFSELTLAEAPSASRQEGSASLLFYRHRPLAATALLSLAGLCMATASLDRTSEAGAPSPIDLFDPLTPHITYAASGGGAPASSLPMGAVQAAVPAMTGPSVTLQPVMAASSASSAAYAPAGVNLISLPRPSMIVAAFNSVVTSGDVVSELDAPPPGYGAASLTPVSASFATAPVAAGENIPSPVCQGAAYGASYGNGRSERPTTVLLSLQRVLYPR